MTRLSGKQFAGLLALVFGLFSGSLRAEVSASLDRDQVAMGDTLRLTIVATEANEDVSDTDLRPLMADFEVLNRSTRSSTNITNGQRTHRRELLVDITPRRQGTLKIPPMRVGQKATRLLLVSVGPPPEGHAGDASVLFEAEVDRGSVYVQGQLLLTLRLQQAVNLESRSISELQLDNAFVVPLEQKSFQRTVQGKPWLVHEVRYAIFPEQSGTLEIPAQSFSARESKPRHSLFDMGGGGRLLRLSSEAVKIEVLPRPDAFPDSTWLPARKLTLQESWSTPPEELRAGESATRTIHIRGEGLQGAQLPPVLFPATGGVKYYPDQPSINDIEIGTGLLGSRQDSAALVPTRAGTLDIPEIRIPWWDIEAGELRYAVLPGRQLSVAAGEPAAGVPAAATASAATPLAQSPAPSLQGAPASPYWQWLAVFSSAGWLLTVAWVFRRRASTAANTDPAPQNHSEKKAYKQLLAACASDSAGAARRSLIAWAAALAGKPEVISLPHVRELFADPPFSGEVDALNSALYAEEAGSWRGDGLASEVKRLREQFSDTTAPDELLGLYPRAA